MSTPILDRYIHALLQTLLMVSVSMAIAIVAGLIIAVVLNATAVDGLYPKPRLNKTLSVTITISRDPRYYFAGRVSACDALPSILGGMTVTAIAMIDTSAMAGAMGGGRPRRHGDSIRL